MPYTATALLLLTMGVTTAPVHAAEGVTEPEELEEQGDMQGDVYKDSWWHAAHEATMDRMEHDPDATSPVRCMPSRLVLYHAEIQPLFCAHRRLSS